MLIKFMAQQSVRYLQTQHNTTNFYQKNWYFSLNFFSQRFLAAMFLSELTAVNFHLYFSNNNNNNNNSTYSSHQFNSGNIISRTKKGVSVNPSFG